MTYDVCIALPAALSHSSDVHVEHNGFISKENDEPCW